MRSPCSAPGGHRSGAAATACAARSAGVILGAMGGQSSRSTAQAGGERVVARGAPSPRVQTLTIAGLAVLFATILVAPSPVGLPAEGQRVIAVAVLAIGLWCTETLPAAVTSLILVVALFLTGGVPGLAPPQCSADDTEAESGSVIRFAAGPVKRIDVPCPLCGSTNTTETSHFGSTACKALYRCEECLEPFDYFKCLR